MAVSSISGGSQSLLTQQLQQLAAKKANGNGQQPRADFAAALTAAGADPNKVSDIQSQIRDAIQQARQNGGGDDREAVKSAVNAVLQKNGVDPAKFEEALKSQHAHRSHRRPAAGDASSADQAQAAQFSRFGPKPGESAAQEASEQGVNLVA